MGELAEFGGVSITVRWTEARISLGSDLLWASSDTDCGSCVQKRNCRPSKSHQRVAMRGGKQRTKEVIRASLDGFDGLR